MEPEFWHQRWQDALTGFHQQDINPHLTRYWSMVQVESGEPVFVPLCGKSMDMLWLRKSHPVLGVELSPIAVEDFFRENRLAFDQREQGAFRVYETRDLCLYCGDFFHLQPAQLQGVRAVYDRAALVALPAPMRRRYAARLTALLPASASMLLLTMEYDQRQMQGPPFAVEETEVRELFADQWSIACLHEENILATQARFRDRGLSRLIEKVYLLSKQ